MPLLLILLLTLLFYAVVCAAVLGVGYGTGRLIHWLWPVLSMGESVIIGLFVLSIATYFYSRIWNAMPADDEDEDEEAGDSDARPYVYSLPPLPTPKPRRRRRKSRDSAWIRDDD